MIKYVPTEHMGIKCLSCRYFLPGIKRSWGCPGFPPECEGGADDDEMTIAWETNLCDYWEKKTTSE